MVKDIRIILVKCFYSKQINNYADGSVSCILIDIGFVTKPYKSACYLFVVKTVGVNHKEAFHDKYSVYLLISAYENLADNDSIYSSNSAAELEYSEEPEKPLWECYRILKPGGAVIYGVTFVWLLYERVKILLSLYKICH